MSFSIADHQNGVKFSCLDAGIPRWANEKSGLRGVFPLGGHVMKRNVGVGLAGLGTVGSGVYKHLVSAGGLIERRTGISFDVRKIAVRDLSKQRGVSVPEGVLTSRWEDLVEDPGVGLVVELIGGIEEPMRLVRAALGAGKPVVTGNKALLAEHGAELFALAGEAGVPIYYEAAVAGGIPIIQAVREAFVANRFETIHGILNGTSNHILTRMAESGIGFPEALGEAKALGYAEADPTLDINGWDAAHKAIILAALAYGFWIPPGEIFVSGIDGVTPEDVRFAGDLGYRIKLLATIKASPRQRIEVRVCPTLVPKTHVLASVNGVFNAISVRGDVVGESLFYGRGAGQDPTSSSVLADLVAAATDLDAPRRSCGFAPHELYGSHLPRGEAVSMFYLRLLVEDRPGVLARIAGVLGDAGIGILSVIQPEVQESEEVPLILMIHHARTDAMEGAARTLSLLPCVKAEPVVFHVEGFAP
jgi:homoserine dehydrogenase